MLNTIVGIVLSKCAFGALLVVIVCSSIHGQPASPTPTTNPSSAPAASSTPSSPAKPVEKSGSDKFKRWIEIDALSISARYRFVETRAHAFLNQLQYQVVARGRFKIDPKGKYSVYAGLFSGQNITSGWNNTGWGVGDPQTNLYLKQLYFDAKPKKWLQIQVGGIGVNHGEGTEVTGYDNDVYLMGERVQIRSPKNLYFDEISVTTAFVGDIQTPSVFRRFDRLDEWNHYQVLVRKQINKRVGFSADYTHDNGRDTLRQAVNIKAKELRFLDRILFENYQRVSPDLGYGFNLFADKNVHPRFTIGGGVAHIDRPGLNADRFPQGTRIYFTTNTKLSRELALNTALIQAIGPLPQAASPRTRLDIVLTYNFLETLKRFKLY